MIEPGLYVGSVMHHRFRPVQRRFEYRVFWLILDLDRLPETTRGLKLMSAERFNLLSFHARDHADGRDGSLREKVAALATAAGFIADGPMLLMTMPRVLGYVFNPISVFFCHDARDRLTAIVWEVSNTFGGRHSYVIGVDDADALVLRQRCRKQLYVSPFIGMDIEYRFRVVRRGGRLTIGIADHDCDGLLMTAAMTAERRPLTDRGLITAFVRMPFETVKVTAAIHWEALRLWLKGARFLNGPPGGEKSIAAHSASAVSSLSIHAPEPQPDKGEQRGGTEDVEIEQPSELIGR